MVIPIDTSVIPEEELPPIDTVPVDVVPVDAVPPAAPIDTVAP